MSDPADDANDLAEMTMQNNLANFRAAQRAESYQFCEDCDTEIPAQRRGILGVTRCIDCQEVHEKKQKHMHKHA